MLLSHNHKFIFVKTFKTAGTSTEIIFEKFCDNEKDIIGCRGAISDKKAVIINKPKNAIKGGKILFRNHIEAKKIKKLVGGRIFNNYFKIANIRNPWDLMVSAFHFKHKSKLDNFTIDELRKSFKIFSKHSVYKYDHIIVNNKFCMDYYVRFEHLHKDINTVLKKLNINHTVTKLPHKKNSNRKIPYQEYYDAESKENVKLKNQKFIDFFDYKF